MQYKMYDLQTIKQKPVVMQAFVLLFARLYSFSFLLLNINLKNGNNY